jgi:uncharacterized protein
LAVDLPSTGPLSEPEWPATLDVRGLIAGGWRPTPFREFILKIHSRCDLSCDYCYMYEMADQSWRDRPRHMSAETVAHTADRIAEHAHTHGLSSVQLVLHGGEPLLAGPDLLASTVTAVRHAAGPDVRVDAGVQTNGVRLDTGFLRLFSDLDVRVGVSLDGAPEAQDRHRRYASGRGSHADVAASLDRLTQGPFRHLFSGLLCTIDVRNDPVATYEALLEYDPPAIDFLLPHGNWTEPPPGREPDSEATPYADWLIAVFDRWYRAPRSETRIRLFGEIMQLLFGGASASEMIGLSPVGVVVVETDGSIEQSDMLKSAYPGAPETGLHVSRDSFDSALLLPSVAARQIGELALSTQCAACAVRSVCGGGLYAHRYRTGNGFANPSVFCPDLFRLITHIHDTVDADVAAWRDGRR